jgi:hypothetical protein
MTSYYKNEIIAHLDFVENYKIAKSHGKSAKSHCKIAKVNCFAVSHLSGLAIARHASLMIKGFKEAY